MSDHRLKSDLAVMYKAFLKWKNAQPRYWVVHWSWDTLCYDPGRYCWFVDILPCIGTPKREINNIIVRSLMGSESKYNINQCKIFDTSKEAKKFLEDKRKELRTKRDLFNQP